MNDFMKIDDFITIESALLEEFKVFIAPHLPDGVVILKSGWEDLFAYYKMAQAARMPVFAMKKQVQKLIGGWFSEGAITAKQPEL